MYQSLMKEAGLEGAGTVDAIHAPIHLQLAQKHYQARVNELRDLILAEETKYKLLVAEIDTIRSNDNAKSRPSEPVSPIPPQEVDANSRPEGESEEAEVTTLSPHNEEPTAQPEPPLAEDDGLHPEQETESRQEEKTGLEDAAEEEEDEQEGNEAGVHNVDIDIPDQEDAETIVAAPPPVEETPTKEPSRSPSPPSPPSPELSRDTSLPPSAQGQEAKEADAASTGSPPQEDVPMEQDHVRVEASGSPQAEDLPEDIDQSMDTTNGDADQVPSPPEPNAEVVEEENDELEAEPAVEETTRRESSPSSVTTRSNTSPFEVQPMVVDDMEMTTKGSEPADVQEDEGDDEPAESPNPQDEPSSHRREGKRKASSIESPAESVRERKRLRDGSEPLDEEEIGTSSGPSRRKGNRQTDEQLANKRFQNVIGLLHSQISQHRNGTIFHNPIKNSEAPDYHEIVKRPMDLKTIKARIKDGAISNSLEFQRDIYLMFANAMMYNRPGSDIYSMAEDMMLESEDFIHSFRQTEGFVRGTQGHQFVDVIFRSQSTASKESKHERKFYGEWIDKASAKHSAPEQFAADALRKLYPDHSLVMTSDWRLQLLNFPGVSAEPIEAAPLVTEVVFIPLARRFGGPLGVVADSVEIGTFKVTWEGLEFIVYITQWPLGFGNRTEYFILHEGTEEPARQMLTKVGIWEDQLHDEIWVFNQGFWQKSRGLWEEVQKANWEDVILKEEFKKALKKDVYGFFSSQEVYRQLAIPWKRGLIMHGPPGNGKTISLKAIMKSCDALGFSPLYVKSFQSYKGEEGAMADVFDKARQVSPCVVILEDLDSLINDRNRSFFLNQLDGLEGNDGLLVIGTTNHFDRLDPGLSTRPSRFDRKFLFDDPDLEERTLYCKYWQTKLESNDEIEFPDVLVDEVAGLTERFSFAYLKEAFVSTLVTLAGLEDDEKVEFSTLLKSQIKTLRKQLDKSSDTDMAPLRAQADLATPNAPARPDKPTMDRDVRVLLDALSEYASKSEASGRPAGAERRYTTLPGTYQTDSSYWRGGDDYRPLPKPAGLSEAMAHTSISDGQKSKRYFQLPSTPPRQSATRDGRPFEWTDGIETRRLAASTSNVHVAGPKRVYTSIQRLADPSPGDRIL
ncbi:hypothetical protein EYR36_006404 [Pleurotus pulmonarius]|nr:hypothetical protein EYR36_006404 [Pleurotus pulmonarius]